MGGLRVGKEITKGLDVGKLGVEFKTIPAGRYPLGSNYQYDANPIQTVDIRDNFAMATTEMTNTQWKVGVYQLREQNTLLVYYADDGKVTILARGTAEEIEAFKAKPVPVNLEASVNANFGGIDVVALGALKAANLGSMLDRNVQTVTLNSTPSSGYNDEGGKFDGGAQPVVGVSWFEASAFAALYGWSLPTKTQWEVAAGDLRDLQYADMEGLEKVAHSSVRTRQHATVDVKSKKANNHELYDMLGNVLEWLSNPFKDGRVDREIRGGSWYNYFPRFVSAVYRLSFHPGYRLVVLGFRVASAVSPQGPSRK